MNANGRGLAVETVDNVVTLTLARRERRNALDESLLVALRSELEELAARPHAQVVILTGTGDVFSAGADMSALKGVTDAAERARIFAPQGRIIGSLVAEIAELLMSPSIISVAAVNGPAVGGGWLLALACDFCIAAESARFWFPEVSLGRVVSEIAARIVLERAGPIRARKILLLATRFDARDLEPMGLLTAVVADSQLIDETRRITTTLAASIPDTLCGIKSQLTKKPYHGDMQ